MLTRENKLYNKNYWNGGWNLWWTAPTGTYNYIDNRYGGGNWSDHYAVKTNGGITFCTQGEGINKISDNIPNGFVLSQNYPNPFNPSTSIKFSVPQKSIVIITIYNVLGEEISKLVNEEFSPGTYETNWNAANYPSGVYYYQLIAKPSDRLERSDGYTETKKMVLIK